MPELVTSSYMGTLSVCPQREDPRTKSRELVNSISTQHKEHRWFNFVAFPAPAPVCKRTHSVTVLPPNICPITSSTCRYWEWDSR